MAKIRSGIEIPIIPEDFTDSEEELNLDTLESYLQWAYRCFQDGLDPTDWTLTNKASEPFPES